jgi:hypothetical protein
MAVQNRIDDEIVFHKTSNYNLRQVAAAEFVTCVKQQTEHVQ